MRICGSEAGHDVAVAGHGLGFNMPSSVAAGHQTAIHIRVQNCSGVVTETNIGYKVNASCTNDDPDADPPGGCPNTGTVTFSSNSSNSTQFCMGITGSVAPGATQVVSDGCTVSFAPGTTGDEWQFTLIVIHCGADGLYPPCPLPGDANVDANNSNNAATTEVDVS